jgi:apolipoprotein N-acyltransferase
VTAVTAADERRAQRPFWLHQAVEYVIGLTLVALATQAPSPAVPAIGGLVVLVNAAVAKGPLGAFDLVDRRLHRVLDLVVIGIVLGLAVQPWIELDVGNRAVMVGVAAVLGVVWWFTDFASHRERAARRAASADRGDSIGRSAGRAAGGVVAAWKQKRS